MPSTLLNVNPNDLSLTWKTPYVSEGVNRKSMTNAKGIVRGFHVVPNYINNGQVYITVDAFTGDSVLESVTDNKRYSLTYRVTSDISLSFAAIGKYWIAFKPNYVASVATSGEIVSYTEAEIDANAHISDDVVMLCCVDYQAIGIIAMSWIMYYGTTSNGNNWQRTTQERFKSEHGRRDLSTIFHDDFRYPAKWDLGGDLTRDIDYEDYYTGCCALRLSNPGGSPLTFTAEKGTYKTSRSVNRGIRPTRYVVEYIYKTSSSFAINGNTGIDIELLMYNRTTGNKVKVLASSLTSSQCPGFKWITAVGTSYKTMRFEVMEPLDDADLYITEMKPRIDVDISSGSIWFDSLRIYQNVPYSKEMGDPDMSYNLEDVCTSTIRMFPVGNTSSSELQLDINEGFVWKSDNFGTLFNVLQLIPPTEIPSFITMGDYGADSAFQIVGHSSRPTGRKTLKLDHLDLEFNDARIELPTESNFGGMIGNAPPVIPGGLLGIFSGIFGDTIRSQWNLTASSGIGGSVRFDFDNIDVDGTALTREDYIVMVTLGNGVASPPSAGLPYTVLVDRNVGLPSGFNVYVYGSDGSVIDPLSGSPADKYFDFEVVAIRSNNIPNWL